MDHVTVTKEYIQVKDNPMENLSENLIRSMPEDMKICMMAHVPIDCTVESSEDGKSMIFKAKTKYPVSILKDKDGRVLDILVDIFNKK